ncbi:Uu.00g082610.m01.CDS01 [Anthostomella pinea]|uniref:Uu.00g082610.m01.CDS01 n=1 Tax=Anthostomella pinea TaxID=933095 RepID=A0AAI8VMK4_9PEZI|nr:Uu.00g082610.m01.CDS01 [Anthostomella pinea]
MTRPQIIRADSIDLQDHDAPSAKEHKHPSSKLSPNPNGSLAPHQAETIREVEEERAEEEGRSPRVSWANGDNDGDLQQYAEDLASGVANSMDGSSMQQQDALAVAQNGGATGTADEDGDMDGDADDGLDDDMMDKISSSPSIEDGGYILIAVPPDFPERYSSLENEVGLLLDRLERQQSSKASAGREEHCCHPHHHHTGEYVGLATSSDYGNDHNNYDDSNNYGKDNGHNRRTHLLDHASDRDIQDLELGSEPLNDLEQPRQEASPCESRDSGVDMKIEDFSVDRLPNTQPVEPGIDEEHITPSYEFLEEPFDYYDDDGFFIFQDPMFNDTGWDSESLQNAEDIDFEFVYALHTFVATVEGQANATKGDTMVLLDDTNSYWWLVRVVKDSSIGMDYVVSVYLEAHELMHLTAGYLPAEHIETPTERLLSARMLGDQAEKTKNPIKTAIRRRQKKTVAFAPPTYVDYSDFDYSTDEEGQDGDAQSQEQGGQQQDKQQQTDAHNNATEALEDDETAMVEPLKPRSQKQVKLDVVKPEETEQVESAAEASRSSDEIFDTKSERTTRNGTVRNTDSFFKDDTIETKKITLTPGLLRDDNESRISSDSKEVRQRPSFDKLEKELVADKSKDDKKRKEKDKKEKDKKPSAIRSFFSRKDKKKSIDDDDESFGKRSMDTGSGTSEKDLVEEPEVIDTESSPDKSGTPQRNPSKLQKQQPRSDPSSPTRKPAVTTPQTSADRAPLLASEVRTTNNVANTPPATLRMVESDQLDSPERPPQKEDKPKSAMSRILPSSSSEPKPPKATKSKSRVELDDFDSPEEEVEEDVPEPTRAPPEPRRQPSEDKPLRPSLPGAFPDSYLGTQMSIPQQAEPAAAKRPAQERLAESPVQVSPVTSSNPPALMVDSSSQEERSSPVSSPSPELADAEGRTHQTQDSTTTASTSAPNTTTWNDANLRAFFDSSTEVRDLLTIVYDTSDVAPPGSEHPVGHTMYLEEKAKLAEITTKLDDMLADFLARKQRRRNRV